MFCYYYFWLVFLQLIPIIYGYNEPRILNGEITPPNLFQFTVFIQSLTKWCTGTIISKRHVLTAAHCLEESLKIEYDTYKVYLKDAYFVKVRYTGENHDFLNLPMSVKVFLPITYKWPWNDIAVLEFPEGTDFGIEPVKLAKDYVEKKGDEAYIAGFGDWWLEGNKSRGISDVLRHKKISLLTNCFGTLNICAGNATHHSLSGDSGGPMLINRNNQWYEIGVLQQNPGYDVRFRVSTYCNFIEEVTKNEAKCDSIYPENYLNGQLLPLKHFEPIYQGQSTPLQLFDFVIPLYNYYYNQGCSATVISKRHLLTSGWCVYRFNSSTRYIKHSSYKTINGKIFLDFRSSKNNVNSNLKHPADLTAYIPLEWPWEHNLAVIEFPKGTDFGIKPITLPYDYFPIYLDNHIVIAGYGKYDIKEHIDELPSPILQHSNAIFQENKDTDRVVPQSYVVFGAHLENNNEPNLENKNLMKDEGGATLIERNGKFYQIGINYYKGTPNGSRTVVSKDCDFIEKVTENEVQCESMAPIYEKPFEATTKQNTNNQESSNNAQLIQSQMLLFITLLTMLYC